MLGVAETDHLPQEGYGQAAARRVYAQLWRKAALALTAGQSVVVDAVHSQAEERDAVGRVAAGLGVAFVGLGLEAPLKARLGRVVDRKNDASDADAAVAKTQTTQGPADDSRWRRLDASGDLPTVTQAARVFLELPAA